MARSWSKFMVAVVVSLIATFAALPAYAQGAWKKLGEKSVSGKIDKDTINVGADDGAFTKIQVRVENSALEMYDINVVFDKGPAFSPNTKLVFKKGESTREIDLPGDKRIIKKVEFRYGNLPGGGNARVELWGKSAGPANTEAASLAPGMKKLGERKVSGKLDKDAIGVGADDGTFTAIQLKIEGSALEMYDVNVVFANGQQFSPNTRLTFSKDSYSRVIDLPGDARTIKKVEFRYGNLPGGGDARVELWAKPGPQPLFAKLGERTVNGKFDKDTINVGADDGRFSAIQVKVEGSKLEMYDVKVVFDNGATFSPDTKLVFDKDSSTRLIDLPGDKRVIKKVEFKYGNLPGGGNARVELWGKR